MVGDVAKKNQTDIGIKRKAVKLVIVHLKKKLPKDNEDLEHINEWLLDMEKLLQKPEFIIIEYIEARKLLNDVIERTLDETTRFKLRDSWYSLGRALDKKVKQR